MNERMRMNKQRFFEPFVGDKYQEGINGKKILVVGASFYCNHTKCQFFLKCTNTENKDSSQFDDKCPEYVKTGKQLHREPTYCINDAPRTYKTFAAYISTLIGDESYEQAWSYLAFTNYVQFFLPCKGKSFRDTRMTDLSERDFHAFNETLVELQPDIVIIWGCVFNSRLREENEYIVDKSELGQSEWYVCHINVPGCHHDVTLINPYHPSSSAWHSKIDTFDKYLSMELTK